MFNKVLIISLLFLVSSCSDVKWKHDCIKASSVNKLDREASEKGSYGWEMVNFAPTGGIRDPYVACFKKKS